MRKSTSLKSRIAIALASLKQCKVKKGYIKVAGRCIKVASRYIKVAGRCIKVAAEIGHTLSQVALAWLRAQSGVIIPIIGTRKLTQFQDYLASLNIILSPEHLQRLNEVSQIELGFPHDFLQSDAIRDRLFGGTFNTIENHRI